MHRLPLFTCLMLASLFYSPALAQLTVHSTEQLLKIEHQAHESALKWATHNNFPAHLKFVQNNALGIVRVENQHPIFFTTHNHIAGAQTQTNPLHEGVTLGLRLTGLGLYIGVWDEGAVLANHQELESRVRLKDFSSASNHATHVAGTLIASGIQAEAKGMAPAARINSFNWDFHSSEMQREANNGLTISNHSYGRIAGWHQLSISPGQKEWYWFGDPSVSETEDYSFGFYDRDASLFDHVAYGNPYFLPVVSAGNERDDQGPLSGPYKALDIQGRWNEYDTSTRAIMPDGDLNGFDTMTSIALAKNVLTVGAVGIDHDEPVLSPFSSAGPADDGRIKPDIMGVGENLLSSIATGTADYARYTGTSMATPNVAGSLLLLQQLALQIRNQPFRSATLKGLAIHTATDLGKKGPDYESGWGLLNTKDAATQINAAFRDPGRIQEDKIENGSILTTELIRSTPGFVKITMSWTDPPGETEQHLGPERLNDKTPSLVNDLDITLTHTETGDVYLPYTLSMELPSEPAQAGDNSVDPLEQIFVEYADEGEYMLQISHKGELKGGIEQPFSLILSGIETASTSITLDSAYAESEIGKAFLKWRTKYETVSGSFVIERANSAPEGSTNTLSLNFTALANITSKGSLIAGESYEYLDEVFLQGKYHYRILFIEENAQSRILVADLSVDIPAPTNFSINSIFPNPATESVQIAIDVPQDMEISYNAYDLLGRQVYRSRPELLSAGRHFIGFDISAWSPGIYFIQVLSLNKQLVRKVVVMR